MRVVAILATFNEQRFIANCLEHLIGNGVEVAMIDNESTDNTLSIAQKYLGRGLLSIDHFPRHGVYNWTGILELKEKLAATLDTDWIMHVDADEIHLSSRPGETLADAFQRADEEGFNAVNFFEYVFVPTREQPDHDHPDYQKTMLWYYPFSPKFPRLIRAWKRPVGAPVELAWSGGHRVKFADQRLSPETLPMRHYLFLGRQHVIEKYVERHYDSGEVARGWHGWRASLDPSTIQLPTESELRRYTADHELDASDPRIRHVLES